MKQIFVIINLFWILGSSAQDTIYVSSDGLPFSNIANHKTWATATNSIQDAINGLNAAEGGEVWIKEGVYYPTQTIPGTNNLGLSGVDSLRMTAFVLRDDVLIYGGFKGDEATLGQREQNDINKNDTIEPWEFSNPTVFSGDINTPGDSTDNCFHVVYGKGCDLERILIDGVTISDGCSFNNPEAVSLPHIVGAGAVNANLNRCIVTRNSARNSGGGLESCLVNNSIIKGNYALNSSGGVKSSEIYNSIIRKNVAISSSAGGAGNSLIVNCIIDSNLAFNGGGIYGGHSFNCTISSNVAENYAGGVYAANATNCLIVNNHAKTGGAGEAMHGAFNGHSTLTNCIITNNEAEEYAGTRTYHLINCIVSRNKANTYSAAGSYISNIYNTILWGNWDSIYYAGCTYSYCAMEGEFEGDGIIKLEAENIKGPMFVNPTDSMGRVKTLEGLESILDADWSLLEASPCVNAGNYKLISDSVETDIIGSHRIMGSNIDIGPYEFEDTLFTRPEKEPSFSQPTKSESILIYPTQTHGKFTIETGDYTIDKLIIVSTTGSREVFDINDENIFEVSIDSYKPGLYFVLVKSAGELFGIGRIIKI